MDIGSRGEGVDDHGPSRRAFDDNGGPVPQVRLPQQLDLGPQVGDEHTGNPHEARLLTDGFGLEARENVDCREHMFFTQRPLVPTRASRMAEEDGADGSVMLPAQRAAALRGRS